MYTYTRTAHPVPFARVGWRRRRPATTIAQRKALTPSEAETAAQLLADTILRTGRVDDVTVGDLTVCLDGKLSSEERTVYTGVEMLGVRESFVRTDYYLERLTAEGVYDREGERLPVSVDTERIAKATNRLLQEE